MDDEPIIIPCGTPGMPPEWTERMNRLLSASYRQTEAIYRKRVESDLLYKGTAEPPVWLWTPRNPPQGDVSVSALFADGRIRKPPHGYAIVDVEDIEGHTTRQRLPIRLDAEEDYGQPSGVRRFTLRSIEGVR